MIWCIIPVKTSYCALKEVCHYKAVVALVILQCSRSVVTVSIPTEARGNEQNHSDTNSLNSLAYKMI